ncbi:MAG: restriction endonuclease [Rhodospirillales bacterium]|nr:restriction endonuclease [Rhodospirillales bacterium]
MSRSALPFGSEFSPAQIDLTVVLELAHEHGADWKAFETAVRDRYFATHATSAYNKGKLANNTKLSLRAYGLIAENDTTLTEVGRALHDLRHDKATLYEALARHILKHCQGMNFVQCLLDMQAAGENITLNTLRHWLQERGLTVPRGAKHMSTLRLWLEKAGIFVSGYRVDQARVNDILGLNVEEFEALARFSPEQRAYLKALANVHGGGPHLSNDIERLAAATYGVAFNEKNLPKQVLYPLRDAAYIDLERGTKSVGRGAKPFLVTATDKLDTDLITPLIDQLEHQTHADLRPLLRKSLKDIRVEVNAKDRHLRGLALEALAFKLMRLIDLRYVATRLRGTATGGAEVDLVFESTRLVFSRWQIQCKNTARVSLDDVAKEVGLTHFLKSNAIVMVSTGDIGGEARRYANKIMADSNLCVVMVDGNDLALIEARPAAIVDVFTREAGHAMELKRLDI